MAQRDENQVEESLDDDLLEDLNPSGQDAELEEQEDEDSSEDDDESDEESNDDSEEERHVVSFDDEEAKASDNEDDEEATPTIKKLRQVTRDQAKELKRLRKLESGKIETESKISKPPAKPTLEDHDYDSNSYDKALFDWRKKSDEYESAIAEEKDVEKKQQEAWQNSQKTYTQRKSALKIDDFDDVESEVMESLSQTQQNVIVHAAKDSAALIYALGKSPQKLKELAAIKDPVKYIWAVAQLEGKVKVETSTRKPSSKPEKRLSGNGSPAGTADKTLDRLREKAEKTGNYSELSAYKRKKKAESKSKSK